MVRNLFKRKKQNNIEETQYENQERESEIIDFGDSSSYYDESAEQMDYNRYDNENYPEEGHAPNAKYGEYIEYDKYDEFNEYGENAEEYPDYLDEEDPEVVYQRRAKYHARMDRFLNNGIIIVGVLFICVLLIAFFM